MPALILFDGVCNLCNGSVQFIIRRDPTVQFNFAAIQSPAGQEQLKGLGLPATELFSIILVEDNQWYSRSTAALRIARKLSGAWPLLYGFIVVPRPIRDWVYDWIARNRYRWFGRQESCMIPTPELRARFRN